LAFTCRAHRSSPRRSGASLIKHPTLSQWAIPIRPLFVDLVDINNADASIAQRATRIRNAINNGSVITMPDGNTVNNRFWQTDAATTTTRWNQLAKALSTATTPGTDWLAPPPAGGGP
jgi:hypothetical protein